MGSPRPSRSTPAKRDTSEIEATKNARRLALPVFVITPGAKPTLRKVYKAWVIDWDDDAQQFLVQFGEESGVEQVREGEAAFELTSGTDGAVRSVRQRLGQAAFCFNAIKRYGAKCALCRITDTALLDAAHLFPDTKKGSNDARNAMVLCALHVGWGVF